MKIKKLTFLFLVMLQTNLMAQDTLVFVDGRIRAVQISEIDTSNQTILYIQNNKSKTVSFNEMMAWKVNNKWRKISSSSGDIINSDKSPYELNQLIFSKINNSSIGKYGLSFCFEPGNLFNTEVRSISLFSHNPTISIKPFFALSEKITFEIPIYYGLSSSNEPYTSYKTAPTGVYDIFDTAFWFSTTTGDSNIVSNFPVLTGFSWNKPYHRPELLFQVGFNTKFYPYRHSRFAFYLGQGFHFGFGNYNQADYFYKFSVDSWSASYYNWDLISEEIIVTKSKFSYLRLETSFGVDLNISKYIALNIEVGISNVMQNNGNPDRVYTQVDNGPVVLKYEGHYNREPYKDLPQGYNNLTGIRPLRHNLSTNIRFALVIKLGELKKKTK